MVGYYPINIEHTTYFVNRSRGSGAEQSLVTVVRSWVCVCVRALVYASCMNTKLHPYFSMRIEREFVCILRHKGSMRLFCFNSIDVAVNATIPVLIVVVIILFFGSSLFLPRLSVQRNTQTLTHSLIPNRTLFRRSNNSVLHPWWASQVQINVIVSGNAHYYQKRAAISAPLLYQNICMYVE